MDPMNIREFLHALWVETLKYRYAILGIFIIGSAAILGTGYLYPKVYTSRVALYADVTNIIGNLLEGQAEITLIDRAKEARDTIFTDRMLRSVAHNSKLDENMSPEDAVEQLRLRLDISSRGDYVYMSYSSASADQSIDVISAVTQVFLDETARKKREESQGAFEFIDQQVKSYQRQLEDAEERLEEFSSQNIDITETSVAQRVTQYKNQIQILELEIQDSEARLQSFEQQLVTEPEFIRIEVEPAITFEETQLQNFQQQLASLRLSYLDTHPDIVSLMDQISALETSIAAEKAANANEGTFSSIENPAYTNLKDLVTAERAQLNASRNRLDNTQRLLEEEYGNAETVAAKQATYQELTRDYAVTKEVYEDMLMRRENARLSMTLDMEGQGVSYKIHEPPSYPLKSDGFQTLHFALAGPVVSLGLPIGLIVLLIILDPRVRSSSYISDNLPAHVKLMTTIPVYKNVIDQYASMRSVIVIVVAGFIYMSIYASLALNLR